MQIAVPAARDQATLGEKLEDSRHDGRLGQRVDGGQVTLHRSLHQRICHRVGKGQCTPETALYPIRFPAMGEVFVEVAMYLVSISTIPLPLGPGGVTFISGKSSIKLNLCSFFNGNTNFFSGLSQIYLYDLYIF